MQELAADAGSCASAALNSQQPLSPPAHCACLARTLATQRGRSLEKVRIFEGRMPGASSSSIMPALAQGALARSTARRPPTRSASVWGAMVLRRAALCQAAHAC